MIYIDRDTLALHGNAVTLLSEACIVLEEIETRFAAAGMPHKEFIETVEYILDDSEDEAAQGADLNGMELDINLDGLLKQLREEKKNGG